MCFLAKNCIISRRMDLFQSFQNFSKSCKHNCIHQVPHTFLYMVGKGVCDMVYMVCNQVCKVSSMAEQAILVAQCILYHPTFAIFQTVHDFYKLRLVDMVHKVFQHICMNHSMAKAAFFPLARPMYFSLDGDHFVFLAALPMDTLA